MAGERYYVRELPDLSNQGGSPNKVGSEKEQVVGESGTGRSDSDNEKAQREKAWTEFVNNMNA